MMERELVNNDRYDVRTNFILFTFYYVSVIVSLTEEDHCKEVDLIKRVCNH